LVEVVLFDVREQVGRGGEVVGVVAGAEAAVDIVIVVAGEADLLQVVLRLRTGRCLANLGDGRQEQGKQQEQEGEHDQELEQGKRGPGSQLHDSSPEEFKPFSREPRASALARGSRLNDKRYS